MAAPAIFVVEDDALLRRALHRMLTSLRYPVHFFDSAEEFLARTDRHARGCLVMDAWTPRMTTAQLGTVLQQRGSQLSVIFIVPSDDTTVYVDTTRCLRKPFSRSELVSQVLATMAECSA